MSYFYSIFLVTVLGAPLFSMDKKNQNDCPGNPKNPMSYHMQPQLWEHRKEKDTGTEHITYKYSDGSKSTYSRYKDSSPQKD